MDNVAEFYARRFAKKRAPEYSAAEAMINSVSPRRQRRCFSKDRGPFRVVTLPFATEHTRLPPNAVAGHTPENEGPTPDTATH